MNLKKVLPGKNVPEEFNVIIEIPSQANPIKYEMDKDSGALFVDRFIGTGMSYPTNYGFIPQTLSEDGDPTDVLVITPFPVIHGAVINCRAIGILKMEDESGIDAKILAVPTTKIYPMYSNIKNTQDLSPLLLEQIKFFFENYKSLEVGKWVKILGWENADIAKEEIVKSLERAPK